ncbi:MAG: hypothetical protein J6S45_07320 [Firmicutes bacterium]|nr:hypothetical protein [Bacillota bacterium]
MQTVIYGICLGIFMTGYLVFAVEEPSRLEERSQKLKEGWIAEGKLWTWKQSRWGRLGKRLSSPWEAILQKQKEDRAEKEIAQGISYLRNAAAMGRGEHMSTELILSELAASSRLLSDVYYSMANYLRLGDGEAALRVMEEQVKVPVASDYGRLLLQWEKLAPSLLMETLTSYQKAIEQVRLTKQKKWDEVISDLVYFPVIMNVMLILINFIYVAYFIEQRDALLTMMG